MLPSIIFNTIDAILTDQKSNQFVCFGDDVGGSEKDGTDNYKSFIGKETYWDPEGTPGYYDMYFFSIQNVKEYLNGEKAVVVEVGPFPMQTFARKFDVTLHADGTTTHHGETAYALLDATRDYTGKWEDATVTREIASRIPTDLTAQEKIANFNLGYIGALGLVGNEIAMMLTVSGCNPTQIGLNGAIGADPASTPRTCTPAQLASGDSSCACCALDDTQRGLNMGGYVAGPDVCGGIIAGIETQGTPGLKTSYDTTVVPGIQGMVPQFCTGIQDGIVAGLETAFKTELQPGIKNMTIDLCNGINDGFISGLSDTYTAMEVFINGIEALAGGTDLAADYWDTTVATRLGLGDSAYDAAVFVIADLLVNNGMYSVDGVQDCTATATTGSSRIGDANCGAALADDNAAYAATLAGVTAGVKANTEAETLAAVTAGLKAEVEAGTYAAVQTATKDSALAGGLELGVAPCEATDPSADPLTEFTCLKGGLLYGTDLSNFFCTDSDDDGNPDTSIFSAGSWDATIAERVAAGDSEYEAAVFTVSDLVVRYGLYPSDPSVACATTGIASDVTCGAPLAREHAAYTATLGVVSAGTDASVQAIAAAAGTVKCTSASGNPATDPMTCLTGGQVMGHDLTGSFCDPTKGWFDASGALIASGGGGSGNGIDNKLCRDYLAEDSAAVGLISLLASYDGGAQILDTGDESAKMGGVFTATALGQFGVTTPLIATHSANDLIFGYPVALLGAIMPMLALPMVWAGINEATGGDPSLAGYDDFLSFKIAILNGKLGEDYPVNDQAGYTTRVGEVCASNCAVEALPGPLSPYKFMCKGTAPDRYDPFYTTEKKGLLEFASNDCKPYSWTFSTVYYCGAIETGKKQALIGGAAAAAGGLANLKAAIGLDASDTTLDPFTLTDAESTALWAAALSGAATAAGVTEEQYLVGFNAQVEAAGSKSCTCADESVNAQGAGFHGCCLADGMAAGTPLTGFGCLTEGAGYLASAQTEDADIEASIERKIERNEEVNAAHPYQMVTCPDDGNDINKVIMSWGATENNITAIYTADVDGSDGSKVVPLGMTVGEGEEGITKGDNHHNATTKLWVSQALRPLTLEWKGNEDLSGVNIARFSPPSNLLNSADAPANVGGPGEPDAAAKGQGQRNNGLQDITHFAPVPIFLSQPNYMAGDTAVLLAQHDIYNCWEYAKYADASNVAPRKDDDSIDFANAGCTLMTEEWVNENKNHMDVFIDIEPGLGLALQGHSRLMASAQTLRTCNPLSPGDEACMLGLDFTQGNCHKEIAAGAWASAGADAQTAIAGWVSMVEGNADWTPADAGLPCSQANVFTPKFKGDMVMPIYWADIWAEAGDDILKSLVDVGKVNGNAAGMATMLMAAGAVCAVIGLVLIALCKSKAGSEVAAA